MKVLLEHQVFVFFFSRACSELLGSIYAEWMNEWIDGWMNFSASICYVGERTPPTPDILRFLSCTRAFQEMPDGWLFPTLPRGTTVPPAPHSALTSCGTRCWSPKPRKPSVPGKAPMSRCFLPPTQPLRAQAEGLMSTARGCFFRCGRILTKVHHSVDLCCESSLLVWEWAHTRSHPHAETPVTFLSQSSGPELPCAPEFFSGSGETSLSIFIPRAGIGTKGRDYCEVGWEAWLNQKSWVRKNSSQLHFHTEALANKPPAGRITSAQATWYLLQIVTVWNSPLALQAIWIQWTPEMNSL